LHLVVQQLRQVIFVSRVGIDVEAPHRQEPLPGRWTFDEHDRDGSLGERHAGVDLIDELLSTAQSQILERHAESVGARCVCCTSVSTGATFVVVTAATQWRVSPHGYTTDFLGHIEIEPPLNDAEMSYLSAFHHSRRWDRPGGPYEVPGNPFVEESPQGDIDAYNRPAPGQPQLWCQWQVCWDGCCLTFDGMEKFYAPVPWLRYLIEHFLAPTAKASLTGLRIFEQFTFNHTLDGLMIGNRRDTREMFAISVEDNVVRERVLVPGAGANRGRPKLPYEQAIDEFADYLADLRTSGRGPRSLGEAG
jgi:hypothetical protein